MTAAKRLLCRAQRHAQRNHALHRVNRTVVAVVAKALAVVALAVVVHKVAVAPVEVVRKVAVVAPVAVVHKAAVPVVVDRALRRVVHAVATDNHFKGRTKKSALFYERIA